jgi:hypothetical protein
VLGWILVVVDSGQIEARVAGWFAGELALLESFRRNDAKTVVWEAAFKERVRQLGREPTKDEAKRSIASSPRRGSPRATSTATRAPASS